jgi:uncharacterized OB-fold protein
VGKSVPVAEGLFALTDAGPRLLGSKCRACNARYFPRTDACRNPECTSGELEEARFGPRGTLWSYAVQNYAPPPPAKYDLPYVPYALGVVDLPDGIRVVGRMTTADPAALAIGGDVELVLEPLCRTADGDDLISWKFRPL